MTREVVRASGCAVCHCALEPRGVSVSGVGPRVWREVTRISFLLGNIGQLAGPGTSLALHGVLSISLSRPLITGKPPYLPSKKSPLIIVFITISSRHTTGTRKWRTAHPQGPTPRPPLILYYLYISCRTDRAADVPLQSRSYNTYIYHSLLTTHETYFSVLFF
jgi:hypothetical protein